MGAGERAEATLAAARMEAAEDLAQLHTLPGARCHQLSGDRASSLRST